MIEAFALAEKGIRHVSGAELGGEVEEVANLAPRIPRRKPSEFLVNRLVHGKQEIEVVVIAARDLTRALAGNINPTPPRGTLRAGVGGLAEMPIAEPCGIDFETVKHACLLGNAPEYALGHG